MTDFVVSSFGTPVMYPFIKLFCIYTVQVLCIRNQCKMCRRRRGKYTLGIFSKENHVSEMVIVTRRFNRISIPLLWFCFNVSVRAVWFCYKQQQYDTRLCRQIVAVSGCVCLFLLVVSALRNLYVYKYS